jgi:fucose 4-O-acetylase-like acetyltransferase
LGVSLCPASRIDKSFGWSQSKPFFIQLFESELWAVGIRLIGDIPVGYQYVQIIGRNTVVFYALSIVVKVGTNQSSTVKILSQFNTIAVICFCMSLHPNVPVP